MVLVIRLIFFPHAEEIVYLQVDLSTCRSHVRPYPADMVYSTNPTQETCVGSCREDMASMLATWARPYTSIWWYRSGRHLSALKSRFWIRLSLRGVKTNPLNIGFEESKSHLISLPNIHCFLVQPKKKTANEFLPYLIRCYTFERTEWCFFRWWRFVTFAR